MKFATVRAKFAASNAKFATVGAKFGGMCLKLCTINFRKSGDGGGDFGPRAAAPGGGWRMADGKLKIAKGVGEMADGRWKIARGGGKLF